MKHSVYILKREGWVGRNRFAKLIRRAPSNWVAELAKRHGVRTRKAIASDGRMVTLYRPEDASKIPPVQERFDNTKWIRDSVDGNWVSRKRLSEIVGITYLQVPLYAKKHNIETKTLNSTRGCGRVIVYNADQIIGDVPSVDMQKEAVHEHIPENISSSIESDINFLNKNLTELRAILKS